MKVLITGCAGFIGFHLAKLLIEKGDDVVGIDNMNDYYDVNLKIDRLSNLGISNNTLGFGEYSISNNGFKFLKLQLEDKKSLYKLFKDEQFDLIINLAAQAGVRYSLSHPDKYVSSNLVGFVNILEACKEHDVKNLVYASSSSVYGNNKEQPFSETNRTDSPISLYAATKKANELLAHSYHHIYNINTTGLRFFTVYGPWGRPDMAPFIFSDAIAKGKVIKVNNFGKMLRDFTFIDDIINGLNLVIEKHKKLMSISTSNFGSDESKYAVYNLGCGNPVNLIDFIKIIENRIGKEARLELRELQDGDMLSTYSDSTNFFHDFDFKPSISLENGIQKFLDWFLPYYNL